MPDFSPEQLRARLPLIADAVNNTLWVGYSGGLDSTVLLHALRQLALPARLCAIHINHQISPKANQWQNHCREFCERLNITFIAEKVTVRNSGKGIEDAARVERYKIFSNCVRAGDFLFTAHHGNDQAETLLLRLMRGTGPRGLAAIARARPLESGGNLIRPLLDFSRAELEDYARLHQLTWVEDESNESDVYDRNFLRNQVLPMLQQRWPGFFRKWQQTAALCAQQENLLDEFAQQDLQAAEVHRERVGQSINLHWLKSLSRPRRQHLLRFWLRQAKCELPETAHFNQLESQLFEVHEHGEVKVSWGAKALRPFQGRLFLLPVQLPALELTWTEVPAAENPGGLYLLADLPDLNVRFRRGGERCKPSRRGHSQTLKKLLQEYGLEPWLRDSVPLIFSGDNLVAVGDLWINEGFVAPQGICALNLTWQIKT